MSPSNQINLAAPLDLGFDLKDVDLSRTIVPAGPYPMRIDAVNVTESKSTVGGKNLQVDFSNEFEVMTEAKPGQHNGASIPKGMFKLSRYYPLQAGATAKDPEAFKRNIAELQDAAFRTTQEDRPQLIPLALVGKVVTAMLKIRDAEGEFQRGNEIARLSAFNA